MLKYLRAKAVDSFNLLEKQMLNVQSKGCKVSRLEVVVFVSLGVVLNVSQNLIELLLILTTVS